MVAMSSALLAFSLAAIILASNGLHQETQKEASKPVLTADTHAVFSPELVGDDADVLQRGELGPALAEADGLYDHLEGRGAEYVDATEYEPDSLAAPRPAGSVTSVTVNANRLSTHPVKAADRSTVDIRPQESKWVVLVPLKYRDIEVQIHAFFTKTRNGDSDYEGARQAQVRYYGGALSPPQDVDIRWIDNNQEFDSDNPAVFPEYKNSITDPIIQVMTENNSLPFDRLNSITGGMGGALKVPLSGQAPEAVLAELKPVLVALNLDDNLTKLSPSYQSDQGATKDVALNRPNHALLITVAVLGLGSSVAILASTFRISGECRGRAKFAILLTFLTCFLSSLLLTKGWRYLTEADGGRLTAVCAFLLGAVLIAQLIARLLTNRRAV